MKQKNATIILPPIEGIGTATTLQGSCSINGTLEVGQTITVTWPTLSGQTPLGTTAELVTDTGVVVASGTLAAPPTTFTVGTLLIGRKLRGVAMACGLGTSVTDLAIALSPWTSVIQGYPAPIASRLLSAQSMYTGEVLSINIAPDFSRGGPVTAYSIINGPSWAVINSTTGILTVSPTEEWHTPITIRGTNSTGYDETQVTLNVTAVDVPVIYDYSLVDNNLTFSVDTDCTIAVLISSDSPATTASIISSGFKAFASTSGVTLTLDKPVQPGTYYVNTVAYVSASSPSVVSTTSFTVVYSGPVILYEEHFNGATWQNQIDGTNIFYNSGSLSTTLENTAVPSITGTGTTGRLWVEGTTDFSEQWLAIPLRHPTAAHNLSFSGAWKNTSGTYASGGFKINWINDSNSVISTVFLVPASSTFGTVDHNCDYSFTNLTPPVGATKLQIGFMLEGANGPRWSRGNAYIYDIVLSENV